MTARTMLSTGLLCILIAAAYPVLGIDANQKDDFQDGTTQGWQRGRSVPTVILSGGPSGSTDSYLLNESDGSGSGGKMVVFNRTGWTGDYPSEGVIRIDAHMANFGASNLYMRIAIQGAGSSRFSSTASVLLPPDGQWYAVSFGLTAADLTQVQGTASLADALATVNALRILSNQAGPSWRGDNIVGSLGVDNIQARTEIVPEITANGLDGPVEVLTTGTVQLEVTLDPGGQLGANGDWFLIADTPFGLFHYDRVDGWQPGISVTFQGPLVDLGPQQVDVAGPPAGTYSIYFGVDLVPDGALNVGSVIYDSVDLNVVAP